MKKIFGISDSRDAYFYEVEVKDLSALIKGLKSSLDDLKNRTITCNFYNN